MPTVRELSAPYENFMLGPRPGPDVCSECFNLTDGYERCYACVRGPAVLDAIVPISYSVAHEQLHHALASYKRLTGDVARRLGMQLAAVLWRFLELHEDCVARAAGVRGFPIVASVPSGDRARDEGHALQWIVSALTGPTRGRYQRLLQRSSNKADPHTFSTDRFAAGCPLKGEPVLLIDDTLTTGANVRSAAATLRSAGSGPVAAVVIGRHVNRDWDENDRRLRQLATPFDWHHCALCAPVETRTKATAA